MTTLFQAEDEVHSAEREDPLSYGPEGDGRASLCSGSANVTVENTGEGIFRITLRSGSRITAEDGIRVREHYLAQTGGAGSAVLLQITGVECVSRDAFRFFSDAATITAFAILGSTSVDCESQR